MATMEERLAALEEENKLLKEKNKIDKETYDQKKDFFRLQKDILEVQGKEAEMVKQIGEAYDAYLKKNIAGFTDISNATEKQKEQIKSASQEFEEDMGLREKSLDKVLEKLEEMDEVFDAGTKAADDFGGSLARQLGMASHHSETFIGKMQELNKTLANPKARQAFNQRIKEIFTFTNMASSLLAKIAESTLAFAFGVDLATAKFAGATGAGRAFTEQIRSIGGQMMRFGVSAEDAGRALTSLYSRFPGFNTLTKENQVELGKNVAALEKLGVSADESAQLFGSLTKTFKVSSKEAAKMVKDLAFGAKAIGKPISAMIKGFAEANKYLATYGTNAVKEFNKIASSAQAAGVEVSDVLALSKKFDTFSSAASTAAKFSAVFGTNLSAMELVTMKVSDRLPYLVQQFKATGREFSQMDRYAQLSAAEILGFGDNVEKAGKVLSMSTTQFGKYNEEQKRAAAQQKEYDQMLKDAMPIMMKFKMAFIQIATALVPLTENVNEFAQGVLDLSSYLKDNWGKALFYVVGGLGLVTAGVIAVGVKAGLTFVPIAGLATAMSGLATALGSIVVTGVPAGASITVVGNSAASAGTRMAPMIAAVGALAAGLGILMFGVSDLVRAFGEFPNSIGPVISVMWNLVGVMTALGLVAAFLGKPMMIAGAAVALLGVGVGIAAAGIGIMLQGVAGIIDKLTVFNEIGFGTVGMIYLLSSAMAVLAVAMTALGNPFALAGMAMVSVLLSQMSEVAERISKVTESLSALANGSVSKAFIELNDSLAELDSALSGKIELKSTIENLALITTGQSSKTMSGGVTDTTSAIKDAFKNLGEMFKPTVKVELDLNNEKLAEFIKTVSVK